MPAVSSAQSPCRATAPPPSKVANIFTEAQEIDLGDAIAERLSYEFRVVDDEALTGLVKAVGTRLIEHLPPTALKFQFFLVDLPEANAFVLPGGRIYVSRKLAAFAQREDELAGVIGHEIGHLIARQQTATMTRQLRDVIGVTSVTDRADIFEKYNRFMDNAARKPKALAQSGAHSDQEQVEADRLGLYLVAAAGYDPDAHARLFDRLTETNGDTGGFFSNLFGATSPNARRLRELLKTTAAVPATCMPAPRAGADEAFRQWQMAVVLSGHVSRKESLTGVVARRALEPPLRGDLETLRFSPDGKWLLAHDSAGISVITREPLRTTFHITAPDAVAPHFSPDSSAIVFHTDDLRVEVWDVARGAIRRATEVVLRDACLETAISPAGDVLACLDGDFDLALYDVATNSKLFEKKSFFRPNLLTLLSLVLSADGDEGLHTGLAFSPDGRYFVAGHREIGYIEIGIGPVEAALVYDLTSKAPVDLKGSARKYLSSGFVFLGDGRIAARNPDDLTKSVYLELPGLEARGAVTLPPGRLDSATRGGWVFVRPFQQYAVGVFDLAKGQVVKGSAYAAMDFYDDAFTTQRTTGELGVYGSTTNQVVGAITLPRDDLDRLRSAIASPDLKWLLVSGQSRGALWDLSTGRQRIGLPAFSGAARTADGQFYVDMLRTSAAPRQVVRVQPATGEGSRVAAITQPRARQVGPGLLSMGPAKPNTSMQDGLKIEGFDITTMKSVWTKTFEKEPPGVETDPRSGHVICFWSTSARTVRDRIKGNARLNAQLSAMKEVEGDYYLEILDVVTGDLKGQLLVETGKGSFRIADATIVGDWAVISDTSNRVEFYSLSTGELKGRVFGRLPVVSLATGVAAVENGSGRVLVYDLATLRPRGEYQFSSRVAFSSFSGDGTRLLVVTSDQQAIELQVQ